MRIAIWNIEALTGYKPITTFWMDFSIADNFGLDAIKDTYRRAFAEWKDDYKYLTELVMVLNWKCHQWYEVDDKKMELYEDLYYKTNDYAWDNLKGEEQKYYYKTTD